MCLLLIEEDTIDMIYTRTVCFFTYPFQSQKREILSDVVLHGVRSTSAKKGRTGRSARLYCATVLCCVSTVIRYILKPSPFPPSRPTPPPRSYRQRARWLFMDDAPGPRGIKAKKGVARQTWQAIAELGQYNYLMEESDVAGTATR